jgi:hypothetical protein
MVFFDGILGVGDDDVRVSDSTDWLMFHGAAQKNAAA